MRAWAVVGLASVLGFGAFDTSAVAATDDTRTAPVSDIDQLARAPEAALDYQVMVGELSLLDGDTQGAAKAYVKALSYSQDSALAQRATQIALAANRQDLAYRAARVWARAAPKDRRAQQAAVRLAFVNKDPQGVEAFAPQLVASADSPRDGYQALARILSDQPDQANMALDTMSRLAAAHPKQAAAQYALGRLALNYNHIDTAASAADKAVADAPDWSEASLLRAAIAVRQGKLEAAVRRVAALKGSDRQRAEYHVALGRMLLQAGNDSKGLTAFKQAVAIDGDFAEARYGLGLVALSQGDLDTAATQFEQLYKSGAHSDDAAFYRGVVAERRQHDAKAIDWYRKVSDGDHQFAAGVRIAQLTYEQGNLDGARDQLHQMADAYPDRSTKLHAVEGGLLVDAGQPKKALAVYDAALKNAPDDTDLLYARSLAYAKLGRVDAAEADLKHILSQDADNPEALNALGYMLTNHSTDYARAERYIRKSLQADPGDPAVLDSLGWVEYKRGHLASARKHLEQAYKGSSDPEIAAHLGAVRWQQGDHDAARRIWHKAQAKHPDNKVLKQTIERLTS
ncbi:tetratricopeptide repeat protein [Salinisphaera sp. LB1]|uniref:tetratricopeptide repeat protein n=1 Tax=Salinisphaera sp. LB1 TaxID=2183911 RepID=UPI000D707C36|nr:tetratricopeptide repeat protein [Salinisphaera sp. LB1]AWN14509.1 TPR domain protein [Salinisphaera sp. LB1]